MKNNYENLLHILIFISIYCVIMNTANYFMLYDMNKTISKYESINTIEDDRQEDTTKKDHEIIVKETDNIIYDKDDKYSCLYLKDIKDMLNENDRIVVCYKDEDLNKYITKIDIKSSKFLINFSNNRILIDTQDGESYALSETDKCIGDSNMRALEFLIKNKDTDKFNSYIIDTIEYISKEDRDRE